MTFSAISLSLLIEHFISSPIVIPAHMRVHLIECLDSWHFEPHNLPEEEVLFRAQILFGSLFQIEYMREDIGVSLGQYYSYLRVATVLSHIGGFQHFASCKISIKSRSRPG
ncbi:uncharacterized protein EDB91DRAFT_744988 [Suillus paluster]|uniref:uncharacterized protein n=1 Tax=Suillus paluster TaxID=48578 RepID=UPI001B880FE9|nr:uncharacterized protein EDB91DRAFT_744988 [Suillus paluster]KAG1730867.1 hypothetical protein EDB91DRAFT_744988 [Suillus paluster]